MSAPSCPTTCIGAMPDVLFSDCAPEINNAQIRNVYIGQIGYPFANWTNAAEWNSRLAMTTNPAAIRRLTVVGDKPKPNASSKKISHDRTVFGKKEHVVNIEIDETNLTNYDMLRLFECGKQYLFWYEDETRMYGGNNGIKASINLDHIIDKDSSNIQLFSGEASWSAKQHPDAILSPIA